MTEADGTDAAVLARMRAAAGFLAEAGLEVDTADDRDSHLRRAVHWQRYGRGPVPAQHRACAGDVVRGSLRLWSMAGGVPVPAGSVGRARRPLARVRLSGLVRTRCAALRTGLAAEAAGLSRRGVADFGDRVRTEVLRACLDVDAAAAEFGLADGSGSALRIEGLLPPRRRPRLENRLTTLLGAGFGTGISLSVGRLAAWLCPGWMPGAALACGLLGAALTIWTVLARRLLAERNAAERWMIEVVANVRPALEERVLTHLLISESGQPAMSQPINQECHSRVNLQSGMPNSPPGRGKACSWQ